MAASEITDDYYAILEVSNTATLDEIRKSYRRLALSLHPDKNTNNPKATALFQRLGRAYEIIKDASLRRAYDIRWPNIKRTQQARKEAERSRTETADRATKAAAEEILRKEREKRARNEQIESLGCERTRYYNENFRLEREVRKLTADLKRLQDLDDEEARKAREKASWWNYFASSIHGRVQETEEEILARELGRLQRAASRRIRNEVLGKRETELKVVNAELQNVERKIAAIKRIDDDENRQREAKRQEKLRKEEEAKRKEEELERQKANAKRFEADQKRRQEEAAAYRARAQAEERARREEAEKRREEQEKRAEAIRREQEAARILAEKLAREMRNTRFRSTRGSTSSYTSASQNTCRHSRFWPKIEGSNLCSNCHSHQKWHAFKCPDCYKIACGSCRQELRGEGRKHPDGRRNGNYQSQFDQGQRFDDFDYSDDYF